MQFLKWSAYIVIFLLLTSCGSSKKFSSQQKNLINYQIKKPMRLFLITNKQDSILLRKKSSYINPKDKLAKILANRLIITVNDSASMGVGIAAPQVGVLKNMICVQRLDKDNLPFEIYLNPIITKYSVKKRPCPEGCLSIPNIQAKTLDRAYEIDLEYDKLDGNHYTETVTDFVSVIFQHEIDHLNGILFLDHLLEETSAKK
ncbi:MAG: peptide deformylase [Flavobacteriaceae bacterium]